jgi:hypothetical protein
MWTHDFEGVRDGTLRIGGRGTRKVEWRRWGYKALAASLHRADIESLAESEGALDIEVRSPNDEALRYRSPESSSFLPALRRFLRDCGRHVREANRQFEVDGIEVDLRVEVDEKGIEDMRALAAQLGIPDVKSIYVGLYGIPTSSLVAIVEGRAVQDGNKISQSRLLLRQKYWPSSWVNSDEVTTTHGLWQTSARNLDNLDRWIVRDGDWSIEVRLEAGVPYDDAVRIIRAIRARTLVDVREGPSWMYPGLSLGPEDLRQWDATTLPRIEIDDEAPAGESGRYEVSIPSSLGSGTMIRVRLLDDRVEVVAVGQWIV